MRVISGYLRSRKLLEVDSLKTRSTKDRVKESLFNMLHPLSQYEHALDLFAGSGALGIEAISRGVSTCDFVELSPEAFKVLKMNLKQLDLSKQVKVNQNGLNYLNTVEKNYDLIILDPPYGEKLVDLALELIAKNNVLQPYGSVVSLSHKEDEISMPQSLKIKKERVIGITKVTFYEWSD